MTQHRVRVALGERAYDILVGGGLLDRAGEHIAPLLRRSFAVIVTDENVAARHLEPLKRALAQQGIGSEAIILPPGEAQKSYAGFEHLCEALLALKVERRDHLIALGGGVIGDLVGFAASVLRRGMDFIQVPTSLLAQVDSSVGGKTAINSRQGKNLIGAFHQPRLVLADVDLLRTLPPRELRAGYAEVVKYGLLGDAEFYAWLEANGTKLLSGDAALLAEAVARCCAHKARIVAADEREEGERALLNLGHTFGHALEAETGYSQRLLHGEGVAVGMALAFRLSGTLGLCDADLAPRVERHLAETGLPARLADVDGAQAFSAERLLDHMRQDKKVRDGKLVFILAEAIGRAVQRDDVPVEAVQGLLSEQLDRRAA
ncbi:MAG TPA: 3-dehydroquinate synthase [Ferrovibrio sp.]|uniref:3-dehydroquinate synthase n=1 Tax=Ferrovibrio sp. TaxID=1917215 RepID=UPI002B4B2900|nr:3-dehydroquinate synthase [Ferrovibrio sp.]HLT77141.1 3-dehydroquinate synthase [Ferrovibrio sp.]